MNSRHCHSIAQHLFPVFLWSLQFDENASHQEKVWDENRGVYHELLLCPSGHFLDKPSNFLGLYLYG